MATVKKKTAAKKAAKAPAKKAPAKKAAAAKPSASAAGLKQLAAAVEAARAAAAAALKAAAAAQAAAKAAREAAKSTGGSGPTRREGPAQSGDWIEGSVTVSQTQSGSSVQVLVPGRASQSLRDALQQARGVRLTAQLPLDGPPLSEAQIEAIVSFFVSIDVCESLVAWCESTEDD